MAGPRISIQGSRDLIRIGKSVVRALGEPEYICLRVNTEMTSLAFRPCGAGDKMSFRVPARFTEKEPKDFRIISKKFVKNVLLQNQLNPDRSYSLDGDYSETKQAVFFDITKAFPTR